MKIISSRKLAFVSLLLVFGVQSGLIQIFGKDPCPNSLFSDLVTGLGYPFEAYSATTSDGYNLRLFRMQAKSSKMQAGKPVVFLQHGIIDSADSWVANEESKSLGFVLANAGYDVWLGNSRGNKYSRSHQSINPSDKKFWDYSFQEMGRYDVKANLELILKTTGKQKLVYIGHSQGTTQMFAALTDPEVSDYVNSKVSKYIALAPVVFLANQASLLVKAMVNTPLLEQGSQMFGAYEWLPGTCSPNAVQSKFQSYVCSIQPIFCNIGLSMFDKDPRYDNEKRMPIFMKHIPSGSSLRSLLHYKQLVKQDKFKPKFLMYDFGTTENEKRYGRRTPPEYDFNRIRIPVRGFLGMRDTLGDPIDNAILESTLRNLNKNYKDYHYSSCGHQTFLWALNPQEMFNDILREVSSA